jgi:FlaG/FlaF family flagellin (archaellin)
MHPSVSRCSRLARRSPIRISTRYPASMSARSVVDHYQADSDSAAEEDVYTLGATSSGGTRSLGAHNYSGTNTPTQLSLISSATRASAPIRVIDPNGLGWPGESTRPTRPSTRF